MKLRAGVRSDIGRSRDRNEDSYLVREPLFVVADGMGGHRGGDVASSMTLETLKDMPLPDEDRLHALVEEIKKANHAVLERGEADRNLRGMGTTVTGILAEDAKAHVVHVGDSRAYLLRDGVLQQLTEDHTLVQRMVREGRITRDQANTHPQRSILTRALGVDQDVDVEQLTLDIHPGDRVLLATDGLTGMIGEDRIREILEGEADPQAACDRLVDAANQAGGEDNITVIVLDFLDGKERARATSAAPATDVATNGTRADGGPARAAPDTVIRTREELLEAESRAASSPTAAKGATQPAKGPPRRRIRWRRVVAWVLVLCAIVAAALVGVRLYVDRQWYVGESNGRVAVYNGIPTEVIGFSLSHVEETTDLSATEAERLATWEGLKDGITAGSLQEARDIVQQIEQDLQTTPPTGTNP
jgi:PPM family protein phosphatase